MPRNSFVPDMAGVFAITAKRSAAINAADPNAPYSDPITELAKTLHPDPFQMTCYCVEKRKGYARVYFKTEERVLPPFEPGQYMVVSFRDRFTMINRPFYIVSSYNEVRKKGIVRIITKDLKMFTPGASYEVNMPFGTFFYESLRDEPSIIAIYEDLAGTPFISMAKSKKVDSISIFESESSKVSLKKEFPASIHFERFKKDLPILGHHSYFISGSPKFVQKNEKYLLSHGIEQRFIRKNIIYPKTPKEYSDHPKVATKNVKITAYYGNQAVEIVGSSNLTIARILELGAIRIKTCCRNGECGTCRVKLISGEVYVPKEKDQRRKADIEVGYVYACSSYPLTDIVIKIPIRY